MIADHDACATPFRPAYTIDRYGRHWQVVDACGEMVCITVYKRGAKEVVRRLCAAQDQTDDANRAPKFDGHISEP